MKKILAATLFGGLLILGLVVINKDRESPVEMREGASVSSATSSKQTNSFSQLGSLKSSLPNTQPPLPASEMEKFQLAVETQNRLRNELRDVFGKYQPEDLVGYESYDEQTLIDLAKSGDLKAFYVQVRSKIKAGNLSTARLLAIESIVNGGVYGFDSLMEINNKIYAKSKDPHIALEGLAWQRAAAGRGVQQTDKYYDNFFAGFDVKLNTPENQEFVKKLSVQLFSQLEKQRQDKGLPQFDNSKIAEAMNSGNVILQLDAKYTLPEFEGIYIEGADY